MYPPVMARLNDFGQPIGDELAGWIPPSAPERHTIEGVYATLAPLEAEHAEPMFGPISQGSDLSWTYLPWDPVRGLPDMRNLIETLNNLDGWSPYVVEVEGQLVGFLAYLRIASQDGAIEVGGIYFSPALQRTMAATEAIYLMIRNAFDLGYRRVEWKCDDLHEVSRKAAHRLGFRYEGTFRQATHYKGRNRDTAWFAIADKDWINLDRAFAAWLSPDNFDAEGIQRQRLATFR
jgi:RimJ/RimL family protein N-acetyltransferase